MKKIKESTLGDLIKWLDECGWDKGIKMLEKNILHTEWLQAELYGNGDAKSIKEANKLSHQITKMNITMIRLYQMINEKSEAPQTPPQAVEEAELKKIQNDSQVQ